MIYLASPYSAVGLPWDSPTAERIRERRYAFTMMAQMHLFNYGYPVFATIVHTHVTAKRYKLPTDFSYWQRYNHHMIDLSNAVFVLQLEGWEDSSGVKDEIDYAGTQAIPVYEIGVEYIDDAIRMNVPIIHELQTLQRIRKGRIPVSCTDAKLVE